MERPRLGAAALLLCGTLAAGCSDSPAPTAPADAAGAITPGMARPSPTTTSAPASGSAAPYEQKFMMNMIDHHQMAVEAAELCVAKAVHEELRQMCEGIIAAQTREIQQMQEWLAEWYGVSYAPRMSKSGQRELQRLASLSGAEFEIAFMDMMIAHHEAAVREARTCVSRAEHKALVRLCERIIAAQTAEIQQLKAWLCEWYQRCA